MEAGWNIARIGHEDRDTSGAVLMGKAERRARDARRLGIRLGPFEFQAPRFDEKPGFSRCGTMGNHSDGHDRPLREKRL